MGDWSMEMTLSKCSSPSIRSWRAGPPRLAVEPPGQRLEHDLVDQRALARARDAGDAGQGADREPHVDAAQVVLPGPLDGQPAPGPPALARQGDRPPPGQVGAGHRAGSPARPRPPCPAATTRPPCSPAPGPMSMRWSAAADHLLVVLHHQHGVALVAQALQGADELAVVALVQADRGLVQDVEHAHEARPDLGRQPDALRLAARERPRGPGRASGTRRPRRRGSAAARSPPAMTRAPIMAWRRVEVEVARRTRARPRPRARSARGSSGRRP